MERTSGSNRKYFIFHMKYETEGVYYTRIFDSGEFGMVWHRLLLSGKNVHKVDKTVTLYASDCLPDEGTDNFERCVRAEFENPMDVLLFEVTGRYLWLKIVVRECGSLESFCERIQIYFPKHTYLTYLPEIYGEDRESASFLERYLGIFQSMYEDLTEKIEKIPALLEPRTENRDMMYEMADWFAVEGLKLWDDRQLFYLLQNIWRIRGQRGTVAGLKELVELYIGREPYVVEYHQIQPFFKEEKRERILKSLYCSHSREFAVLIEDESAGEKNRFLGLKQIIDFTRPAHMDCRIVILKPYIFLDQHSYLGINSVLGQYRLCCLDGVCAVPFSIIAGSEKGRGTT